jgi:protein AIR1/2
MTLPHQPDFPREPSAFSEHNLQSGPFYDLATESTKKKRTRAKKQRDFEAQGGWGSELPTEVGKQARKKERARMEKMAADQVEEDEVDWFNNPSNVRNRGMTQPANGKRKSMTIDLPDRKRPGGGDLASPSSSSPGLLARIGNRYDAAGTSSRQNKRNRDRGWTRDHYHNDRKDYDSREQRRGKDQPRWSGGYS